MHGEVCIGDAVNWEHPLNRSLVSWWLALPGQQRGVIFRDLCMRNHGTLTSMDPTTDWAGANGRPGGWGSLDFDGTNDYVNIPGTSSSTFMLLNPFTISCWYKYTGATSLEYLMSIGRDFRKIGLRTRDLGSGVDIFRDGVDATSGPVSLGNAWHHVAGTYNGVSITLYVDGESKASALSGSLSDAAPVTWKLGADAVAGATFQGFLDDLRVYTRSLSASEIRGLYQQSRQGYPDLLNWTRSPRISPAEEAPGGGSILMQMLMNGLFTGRAA